MNDSRVALITGAGSGIGRACALALAGAGYTAVLAGSRPGPLEETAAAAPPGTTLCVPADVGDPAAVDRLFATIRARFGRLDVLFNNAGIAANAPLDELSFERWEKVVNVNLTGAFLCAQGAFRLMSEQTPRGGRIINNGSISAHSPRPNSIAYTATKHAITGLTKSIALEGRGYDIACSQIDIGNALTPLTQRFTEGVRQADGSLKPEPTFDVSEVAKAVLMIAGLPPGTNVLFMTIMATNMPFTGRG